jgi:hypothetical protein
MIDFLNLACVRTPVSRATAWRTSSLGSHKEAGGATRAAGGQEEGCELGRGPRSKVSRFT